MDRNGRDRGGRAANSLDHWTLCLLKHVFIAGKRFFKVDEQSVS